MPPIPWILQMLNPQYGTCAICGLPWNHCTPHSIMIDTKRGVFAQCTYCYQHNNSETILKANKKLWKTWEKEGVNPNFTSTQFLLAIHKDLQENKKDET